MLVGSQLSAQKEDDVQASASNIRCASSNIYSLTMACSMGGPAGIAVCSSGTAFAG